MSNSLSAKKLIKFVILERNRGKYLAPRFRNAEIQFRTCKNIKELSNGTWIHMVVIGGMELLLRSMVWSVI